MLSKMFLIFLVSSSTGVISGLTHVFYRSKCKHILCCGCLEIDRDTDAELELDELEMNKPDHKNKNDE